MSPHWKPKGADRVSHNIVRRKRYIDHAASPSPRQCNIIDTRDGSILNHFWSVKSAKKALARLVNLLPKKKDPSEPKKFIIQKL